MSIPELRRVETNFNEKIGCKFQVERGYTEIPLAEIKGDSFLKAVADNQAIEDEPYLSPWILNEIKSLTNLSERLDREMGFEILVGPDGTVFMSEQITLGEQRGISGRFLSPMMDIPEGYEWIADFHTHVLNGSEGLAAFSNGFWGDWNNIIVRGDRFLNIVGTSQGYIYIAYREDGAIKPIIERFISEQKPDLIVHSDQEKYDAYLEYLMGENGIINTEEMTTVSGDDNNKRIEINIKMCELFGFDLYQIDMKTGKGKKLERPESKLQ